MRQLVLQLKEELKRRTRMDNLGEILIYQADDGLTNIEVKMQNETVGLLKNK